jgi:hypothetical protein
LNIGAVSSTALAVSVTGGVGVDTVNITGTTTNTSITVTGNLGTGSDVLNVNGQLSTGAATLNISGVTNYDTASISGGRGADTITGGLGNDRINGYLGADTLTGNGGNDTFVFWNGDSNVDAPDTIVDFNSGDIIEYAGTTTAIYGNAASSGTTEITGTTTTATISTKGVATFTLATTSTTLANKTALIDAALGTAAGTSVFFQHGTDTYLYVDAGTATTNIVIKLTGVAIPVDAITAVATGITGFGY